MRRPTGIAASVLLLLALLPFQFHPVAAAAPALPADRLHFGLANNNLTWVTGSGVPWRYRYTYLAGGVNTSGNWLTWQDLSKPAGQYAVDYMAASGANGYIPVFTWYQLLQSLPSVGADESARDFNNLNDPATMSSYYSSFRILMQRAGSYGGPTVVHVEPDLWGYLQQRSQNTTANQVSASVAGSGFGDVAGFPNTTQGFAGALLHLRDLYAPNVAMAIHASLWSSGIDVGSSIGTWFNSATEAGRTAHFLLSAGNWDIVFNDVDDHDAGWWEQQGANNSTFTHWWDPSNADPARPNFGRYLTWVSALHAATGRPQVAWQVPIGNQYFLTMNNTCGHYQDNVAAYFISHPSDLFSAGLVAVMFGAGNSCQTTNEDGMNDGVTNNNGIPTTDAAGWCTACNTHAATYSDDDGGFLRIFVGAYYAPPIRTTAVSNEQYRLTGSDGAGWQPIDSANLSLRFTPTTDSSVIVSGNSDLWTADAGFNQDLGIWIRGGAYATGTLAAWKESGGFAGTFSPNAAAVHFVLAAAANTTYTLELVWKTNRPAPGATIFAGAGATAPYSPTRLSVQQVPIAAGTVSTVVSPRQYTLGNSDGTTWQTMDGTNLQSSFTPAVAATALLTANADLWTADAGFNQDLGIWLQGGIYGGGQLVDWKESGGNAGTFSPNAATVQISVPVEKGTTYTMKVVWKANKSAAGATIYAGAGPGAPFSPTRLTAYLLSPPSVIGTASNRQYSLLNSDGTAWGPIDNSQLSVSLTPGATGPYVLSANSDLWTANVGLNQDLGISVSGGSYGAGRVVAWKESGGFAGTESPNAAYVETVENLQSGTTYTVRLVWKTNRTSSGETIYAGAGAAPRYSPTTLIVIPQA